MTGNALIASALRMIGVLPVGENPDAPSSQNALVILNQMLDAWTAEQLMIFNTTIDEFTLTPGTQTYTYGTGGTFNAVRPSKIERCSIVSLNNPAQPLELPIDYWSDAEWQAVPVKIITSTLPSAVYDDGDFPFRNLSYWPIPSIAVKTRIYRWEALTQFANLTTDYLFPAAYIEAVKYNLAIRFAAEWNAQPSAYVVGLASESKDRVKSANAYAPKLRCDPALTGDAGQYNYITDMPVSR